MFTVFAGMIGVTVFGLMFMLLRDLPLARLRPLEEATCHCANVNAGRMSGQGLYQNARNETKEAYRWRGGHS